MSTDLPATIDQTANLPAPLGIFADETQFAHAQRVAKVLASSTMVPDHFKNNIGNVLIALNLSERYGADPFMVMQNIYIVHNKPGIEAKLTIARINSIGRFSPLRWKHENEGTDKWRCVCYATEKGTGEVLDVDLDWDVVKKEGWLDKAGSKWKTMPKLMMQYRTATFFGRLYCPEATLGMMTADEIEDSWELRRQPNGSYAVPVPRDPDPEPISFNDRLGREPDGDRMNEYLEAAAAHYKVEVETIKEGASAGDEAWSELMKTYRAWCVKHPADDPPPAKMPPLTAFENEAWLCNENGEITDRMQAALEACGMANMPTAIEDKRRVGEALKV
jgi:hypothetical protein